MNTKQILLLGGRRLLILFVISLTVVWAGSEVAFTIQKEKYDRAPQEIELVIPAGTAERVAAGEPVPSIPDEMVFVLGDTLVVSNQDLVGHQLGPLLVPPGAKASLALEQPSKYAYQCSFQPTRYLGIDVRQPTTLATRLAALGLATPPTTAFLFFYSLIVWPLKPRQEPEAVADAMVDQVKAAQ
jgi:hypothetical protein